MFIHLLLSLPSTDLCASGNFRHNGCSSMLPHSGLSTPTSSRYGTSLSQAPEAKTERFVRDKNSVTEAQCGVGSRSGTGKSGRDGETEPVTSVWPMDLGRSTHIHFVEMFVSQLSTKKHRAVYIVTPLSILTTTL